MGAVAELGEAYGHVAAGRGLPGGVAGEWLTSWSWIVDVAAWVVVVLLFPDPRLPGRGWRPAVWASLAGAALLLAGLVAAVAAAVLRYRPYDIDRIVSRTLAWGLLTLVLGLGYAGVVPGLGRLPPDSSSLAMAAAMTPAGPSRRSAAGCARRSTLTPSPAGCWP